jgi:hypothetical protein
VNVDARYMSRLLFSCGPFCALTFAKSHSQHLLRQSGYQYMFHKKYLVSMPHIFLGVVCLTLQFF